MPKPDLKKRENKIYVARSIMLDKNEMKTDCNSIRTNPVTKRMKFRTKMKQFLFTTYLFFVFFFLI